LLQTEETNSPQLQQITKETGINQPTTSQVKSSEEKKNKPKKKTQID